MLTLSIFMITPLLLLQFEETQWGQESRPLSSFGYTDPFHARDAEEEDGTCIMTAEEEALLQTL